MVVRTLDQDLDHNELKVSQGWDGDIHVTVIEYREDGVPVPHNVRVGGFHSGGPDMPNELFHALAQVARVFKKYEDCQYESDAYKKEQELISENNFYNHVESFQEEV